MGLLALLTLTVASGCGVDETGEPPIKYNDDGTARTSDFRPLYFPIGIATHPDGRYLFIANAGFDRRYNAGTISVYDTLTGTFSPDLAVTIGLFAGDLVAGRTPPSEEGGEPGPVQLFVATRDKSELWRVVVAEDTSGITGLTATPTRDFGGAAFSPEPYGLALDADGQGLTVTHTADGAVSRWSARPEAWTIASGDGPKPFRCATVVNRTATAVTRHPVNGWWYISDRFSPFIKTVAEIPEEPGRATVESAPDGPCRLFQAGTGVFRVEPLDDGSRSRGIAFDRSGSLLYVAAFTAGSSGGALRVFDTTVSTNGRPANRLVKAVGLGARPNLVRVAGCRPDRCPADVDPDSIDAKGEGLVYVTAFQSDRLFVVDPASLAVVARIDMGDGPHDIVFMLDGDGQLRGYVTNFNDNTLTVVDLEPGSPTRFTVLATIDPEQL